MRKITATLSIVCILAFCSGTLAQETVTDASAWLRIASDANQSSSARLEPAQMNGRSGVAVVFKGTDDLHYYANPQTAPAPGFELQIKAESEEFDFEKPGFPEYGIFTDPLGKSVEVYVSDFKVFVPIKEPVTSEQGQARITITGIACTSKVCLPPFEHTIATELDLSQKSSWLQLTPPAAVAPTDVPAAPAGPSYPVWFALTIALVAGLALNIMPCVWPVLPLIVMRIVKSAQEGKSRSIMMGLAFCLGILLFFACIAGANIILQSFYQTTYGWGDHLRNPVAVSILAVVMIVMALFMFGVFTITVPSSVGGKSGSAGGYVGSIGMGLLAALLSTPCSFGILGAAFVWAIGQPLALGTLAIMTIGVGMALPYAILTSMPGLLNRLPRAGQWMELFKQSLGFVLLIIAVKMIKAVPADIKVELLYFCVVLSFCLWMWGSWVTYGMKRSKKIIIRGLAVVLVVVAFRFFFAPEPIDWQKFDQGLIQNTRMQDKPVLIKFTADWCTNCEIVDKVVYQRKDVASLIEEKDVLAIKADTTTKELPATLALKNTYNEPGTPVPITILLIPGEEEPLKWREIFFAEELIEKLETLDSVESGNGEKEK